MALASRLCIASVSRAMPKRNFGNMSAKPNYYIEVQIAELIDLSTLRVILSLATVIGAPSVNAVLVFSSEWLDLVSCVLSRLFVGLPFRHSIYIYVCVLKQPLTSWYFALSLISSHVFISSLALLFVCYLRRRIAI